MLVGGGEERVQREPLGEDPKRAAVVRADEVRDRAPARRLGLRPGELLTQRGVRLAAFVVAPEQRRLERGQFKLPHMDPATMAVEIDATQLAMLLDGIDFGRVRRPDHWKPPSQKDRLGGRPMDKPASP